LFRKLLMYFGSIYENRTIKRGKIVWYILTVTGLKVAALLCSQKSTSRIKIKPSKCIFDDTYLKVTQAANYCSNIILTYPKNWKENQVYVNVL